MIQINGDGSKIPIDLLLYRWNSTEKSFAEKHDLLSQLRSPTNYNLPNTIFPIENKNEPPHVVISDDFAEIVYSEKIKIEKKVTSI